MEGLNFIAIDFETATGKRASICEAGICVVKDGKVVETKSWLVRPEDNAYSYWNIQIHGIHPEDTENAPEFPEVWSEILEYLDELDEKVESAPVIHEVKAIPSTRPVAWHSRAKQAKKTHRSRHINTPMRRCPAWTVT